jgi:hypothetical protein
VNVPGFLLVLVACFSAFGAERHLTLRFEDGMPWRENCALPITIVLPIRDGKGGAGAGLASSVAYGPYTVDGTRLTVAGDRVTGAISGKARDGAAMPVWTVEATVAADRVSGTATAPAQGRSAAVRSRVTGCLDPAEGGAWLIECGMPWTDSGSHAKLAADGSDWGQSFQVRLRFGKGGGSVLRVGAPEGDARRLQAQKIEGTPESFTADITCLALDGKMPIRITLKGGRIGRGGMVEATIAVADKAWGGRVKDWKGAATVWAWPDAPGFVGGTEKDLEQWAHDAKPDPKLVEAAQTEAAIPIHPAKPGQGEIWTHNVLQRSAPRCIAPPLFDIRPLPAAQSYRLTVKRIYGKPLTLVGEDCQDPYAALAAAWPKGDLQDKLPLGLFRFQFGVGDQTVWAMDAWLGRSRSGEAPSWLAPVMQAGKYRVRVTRDKEDKPCIETTVDKPHDPLTAVWAKLTPGGYSLDVQGLGEDGKALGARPWRVSFTKVPAFDGPYFAKPARPYNEAALALARWTCDHPALGSMRGHGVRHVPGSGDNGGCQIVLGAVWSGLVRHLLADDANEREAGLLLAREACENLRGNCLARGGMPKVYKEGIANAPLFGAAFLDMYAATREPRWREAAEMAARAFAERQLANGTWAELEPGGGKGIVPLEKVEGSRSDAERRIHEAGLIPGIHGPHLAEFDCSEVLWFLGRLRKELKTDAFRDCEEKAYRWVMENSVLPFFWRDQGHHSPCMVPPFRHTGRCASYFALYLLEAAPEERCDLDLAAELMRFSETCHLDWSRADPQGNTVQPSLVSANSRESGSAIWLGTRFALVWTKLGQRTGKGLYLEKARAIMDAITHAQHPETGNISTGLGREISFDRFTINAGQCAWNLKAFAELLKAPARTNAARP